MKARILNKAVEIPSERVRGSVETHALKAGGENHSTASGCPKVENRKVPGGRPARDMETGAAPVPVPNPAPSPYIFSLGMQIPSGKNAVQITRNGKRYPQKRFKDWREAAMLAIGKTPAFDGPVSLTVDYTPGDKIRRDVPGLLDAICHLLEKIGTVQDDAQVKCVTWTSYPVEKRKPRCHVMVTPLYNMPGSGPVEKV